MRPRRTHYVDPLRAQRLLRFTDAAVLFVAAMASILFGAATWIPPHAAALVGFLALEAAVGSVLIMSWMGLYGIDVLAAPRRSIAGALATTLLVGVIIFAAARFGAIALQPLWLAGWLALCLVHVTITRSAAAAWARPKAARGAFRRRVAVVGSGRAADEAVRLLNASDGLEVVGVFDDRSGRSEAQASPAGRGGRRRPALSELARQAGDHLVDIVIVAIPLSADTRLLKALQRLWPLPVDVRIAGQVSQLKLSPRAYGYLGKLPLLSIFDRSLTARLGAKAMIDRGAAAVLLVILAPVMALAAVAIRLESGGPVLIRHQRYGFSREPIAVWRFRCTRDGSDVGAWAACGDAAVPFTAVGRWLHQLRLDGLPQLVNVLRGDLSLVGPRPRATGSHTAAALYHQVIDGYFARHRLKPGMTGWAQINDWQDQAWTREAIDNRVKHDLEYVDRWSLLFDLYILAKTPFAMLRSAHGGGS